VHLVHKVCKVTKFGFVFYFIPFYSSAQTPEEHYTHRLTTYFSKDHKVKDMVSISKDSLIILSDEPTIPKISLSWDEVRILSPLISTISEEELKKLVINKKDSLSFFIKKDTIKERSSPYTPKGMKIAIDPGHIGGGYNMGFTESRCMTLAIDSTNQIQLVEGNLTFYTALLLKHKLDSIGVQTMLTRTDTGVSSLGITFYQWKKKIKDTAYLDSLINNDLISDKGVRLLKAHLSDKVLFGEVFGSVDMAARAKKINAFQPDITVIIHYNVNEKNAGWNHTTDKDYVMTFVPGCVTSEDMKTLAGRLNFLRLLLSSDIEKSVKLSSAVAKNISSKLNVPLAQKTDATYLTEHCLSTSKTGVYSRDLALTRLIRGPLVYGEPLYQDNTSECLLLTAKDDSISGFVVSKRIELVAQAYYDGILEYIQEK
jgi:N-acetylmuramoyl-L-alanine amidase